MSDKVKLLKISNKNIVKENNNPVLIDYPYGANFEFL